MIKFLDLEQINAKIKKTLHVVWCLLNEENRIFIKNFREEK